MRKKRYYGIVIEFLILIVFIRLFWENRALKKENSQIVIKMDKLLERNNRLDSYYELYNLWLNNKNINLRNALEKMGYKTLAIYGCGVVGENLISALKQESANLKYVIDKKDFNEERADKILCVNASDNERLKQMETDVIIVTPIFSYKEIRNLLAANVNCDICSLKDLLEEIQYE